MYLSPVHGRRDLQIQGQQASDTVAAVPDTGYTGIKQFMSGKYLVSEVTFKNGVKEGLKKTFYTSGKVRQTFWYENNLREDSSQDGIMKRDRCFVPPHTYMTL